MIVGIATVRHKIAYSEFGKLGIPEKFSADDYEVFQVTRTQVFYM
jgi:hypothetical protein